MKYKYTGSVPAVVLVENELKKILPGTEVELERKSFRLFFGYPSSSTEERSKNSIQD